MKKTILAAIAAFALITLARADGVDITSQVVSWESKQYQQHQTQWYDTGWFGTHLDHSSSMSKTWFEDDPRSPAYQGSRWKMRFQGLNVNKWPDDHYTYNKLESTTAKFYYRWNGSETVEAVYVIEYIEPREGQPYFNRNGLYTDGATIHQMRVMFDPDGPREGWVGDQVWSWSYSGGFALEQKTGEITVRADLGPWPYQFVTADVQAINVTTGNTAWIQTENLSGGTIVEFLIREQDFTSGNNGTLFEDPFVQYTLEQ